MFRHIQNSTDIELHNKHLTDGDGDVWMWVFPVDMHAKTYLEKELMKRIRNDFKLKNALHVICSHVHHGLQGVISVHQYMSMPKCVLTRSDMLQTMIRRLFVNVTLSEDIVYNHLRYPDGSTSYSTSTLRRPVGYFTYSSFVRSMKVDALIGIEQSAIIRASGVTHNNVFNTIQLYTNNVIDVNLCYKTVTDADHCTWLWIYPTEFHEQHSTRKQKYLEKELMRTVKPDMKLHSAVHLIYSMVTARAARDAYIYKYTSIPHDVFMNVYQALPAIVKNMISHEEEKSYYMTVDPRPGGSVLNTSKYPIYLNVCVVIKCVVRHIVHDVLFGLEMSKEMNPTFSDFQYTDTVADVINKARENVRLSSPPPPSPEHSSEGDAASDSDVNSEFEAMMEAELFGDMERVHSNQESVASPGTGCSASPESSPC